MKRNGRLLARLALSMAVLAVATLLGQWVFARVGHQPVHLSSDWSNRHMIYAQPRTFLGALRLSHDKRFGDQVLRHGGPILGPPFRGGHGISNRESLRVDWGMSLLQNASTGAEMFPAKFTFDVNAPPDCTNDYVIYNTGVGGLVPEEATQTGTVNTNTGSNGQTVTITNGATVLTLTANPANTGLSFAIGATSTVTATNLAAAILRNGFTTHFPQSGSSPGRRATERFRSVIRSWIRFENTLPTRPHITRG